MGDRITTLGVDLFIPAAHKFSAMAAVMEACRGLWGDSDGTDPIEAATSFAEVMAQMQWFVKEDPTTGDVVGLSIDKKPYGDDKVVSAIAHFVREGSVIEMVNSEYTFWRWKFTGGAVVRQEGRVVYDE